MRNFISSLTLGILVIIWEFLLQFGTVQLVLATLRAKGPTGALMANFLSSQAVILAIALVAILLGIAGIKESRKQRKPKADDGQRRKKAEADSVTQVMKGSPHGRQVGGNFTSSDVADSQRKTE